MSLNILIACKETTKEFFDRKYGPNNLQKACAEQNEDISKVLEAHDTQHMNLDRLVKSFNLHNIEPVVRGRVNTSKLIKYSCDDFKQANVVVSFGGDGEAIDTARSITQEKLEDDKIRKVWVEMADPFSVAALAVTRKYAYNEKVEKLIKQEYETKKWARTRGIIKINEKIEVEDIALNDIFFGDTYMQGMGRYNLHVNGKSEFQRANGGIVSTKTGLLAWLLNIQSPKLTHDIIDRFRTPFYWHIKKPDFENPTLEYRIIMPSKKMKLKLLGGKIKPDTMFVVKSTMNYDGVVSFDGSKPHYENSRCYDFNRGKTLEIMPANDPIYAIRF